MPDVLGQVPEQWPKSGHVGTILHAASDLIRFPDVQKICDATDKEFIIEGWQLEHLEPSEWKALGAPMGIRSAVRRILCSPPGTATGTAPKHSKLPTTNSRPPVTIQDPPPLNNMEMVDSIVLTEEDLLADQSKASATNASRISRLWRLTSLRDWMIPVDHQTVFKRALLHAKDGASLKNYLLSLCDMWLLVLALMLGCSLVVWQGVPVSWFEKQGDPGMFGLTAYHCLSFLCSLSLSVNIYLWAVLRIIGGTVSTANFKTWMLMHMGCIRKAEHFVAASFYLWFALLNCLAHVQIQNVCPKWSVVFHVVVLVIFVRAVFVLFFNLNYIARVTLHVGHMSAGRPPSVKTRWDRDSAAAHAIMENGGTVKEIEKQWIAEALLQLEPDEERVLQTILERSLEEKKQGEQNEEQHQQKSKPMEASLLNLPRQTVLARPFSV